jgi:hypothetical protein
MVFVPVVQFGVQRVPPRTLPAQFKIELRKFRGEVKVWVLDGQPSKVVGRDSDGLTREGVALLGFLTVHW